jgi:hypothetical protein
LIRILVKVRAMTPDLEAALSLLEECGAALHRFTPYSTAIVTPPPDPEQERREKEARMIEGINNAAPPSHLRDVRAWREAAEDRTINREVRGSKAHAVRKVILAQTKDFQSTDIARVMPQWRTNLISHQCAILAKEGKLVDVQPDKLKYKWFRVAR